MCLNSHSSFFNHILNFFHIQINSNSADFWKKATETVRLCYSSGLGLVDLLSGYLLLNNIEETFSKIKKKFNPKIIAFLIF